MRKQNRIAALGRAARAAADLPQRQRRRPHPRRDGLALLRACRSTSAPSCRRREGCPEIPRLIAVARARASATRRCTPRWAHYVVMTQNAAIALSGPPVVAAAIGEELTADELGGPKVVRGAAAATRTSSSTTSTPRSPRSSGVLAYLPDSARATRRRSRAAAAPARDRRAAARRSCPPTRAAATTCARCSRRSSTRDSIAAVGRALRRAACSARSARLEGEAVGVVASQPMQRGRRDGRARRSTKEAAFIDLCDTFNLPLVFLQDVPGPDDRLARPSAAASSRGYERVVARLARAQVPKIAVVVRKAYGGGHFALGGRPTHPDLVLAWPTAELGLHGARRRASARCTSAGSRRCSRDEGKEAHDALVDELAADWAARVRALGGGGAHLHRRRDRPARDARGDRRRHRLRVGQRPAHAVPNARPGRSRCPAGPLAHICLARPRPRPGDRRLDARSSAELDPGPARRADRPRRPLGGRRGRDVVGDVREPAAAARSSSSARSTTARSAGGSRSAARACTTSASPRPTCRRRRSGSTRAGIKLTSTELSQDPARAWQALDVHRARVEPRPARRARLPVPAGRRHVGARRGRSGLS